MIRIIRGVRVMLDRDLAKIYGVPTFRFNEAIKRNRHRFPKDFMFQLSRAEFDSLTSQIAMSKPENSSQIAMSKTGRGGRRTLPYAFTEHGAELVHSNSSFPIWELLCRYAWIVMQFRPCTAAR